MSIDRFFVRDVDILHPALVASYGDAQREDYVDATVTRVKGWLHQLSESELQSATRDAKISTHVLRLPEGTDVLPVDRVRIDGQLFDVDGPPARVWTPGGEHHVKVSLSYTES